jgi:NADH:ubiquinone oxidoreductase subunit E
VRRERGHVRLAAGGLVAAAIVMIACAGALVADYAYARARLAADTARVAGLQVQARADPSAARTLEGEQDAISRARRARKARGDVLAFVLIAASAVFIGSVKWVNAQGSRRPPAPPIPVRLRLMTSAKTSALHDAAGARPQAPAPTAIDLAFVERIVEREGTSTEAAITILQAIQTHYRYLPDEALQRVCELTEITPPQIAGTSSFYARFRRSPVGEHVVRVCHGTACHVSGARQITDELRRQLEIPDGADTDPHGLFTIDEVACLGCCSLAPVLMIDEHTEGRLTPDSASTALSALAQHR